MATTKRGKILTPAQQYDLLQDGQVALAKLYEAGNPIALDLTWLLIGAWLNEFVESERCAERAVAAR